MRIRVPEQWSQEMLNQEPPFLGFQHENRLVAVRRTARRNDPKKPVTEAKAMSSLDDPSDSSSGHLSGSHLREALR